MKRHLLFGIGLALIALTSCGAKRDFAKHNLPPYEKVIAINDSIINEGWQLYYSEMANWIATDLVFERYDMAQLGSSVSWQPKNNLWRVVFFDKGNENCVLDYQFDVASKETVILDSVRPISAEEVALLNRKNKLLEEGIKQYGDQMSFATQSYGNPNIDIVRINDTLTRVYFLQGTVLPNVIPFGNDCSIDFNESQKPIAFRKYHQSLISCPTQSEKGEAVTMTWHSHLKDNPFITPTDICNFLLYRPKDMDSFCVFSTAYNCMYTYSLSLNQIIIELR